MKKERSRSQKKIIQSIFGWIVAIICILLLFIFFSEMNRQRIIEQNENYIQDNAELKAAQVDKSFSAALEHIEMMTYWFESTLDSPEITPEQLKIWKPIRNLITSALSTPKASIWLPTEKPTTLWTAIIISTV